MRRLCVSGHAAGKFPPWPLLASALCLDPNLYSRLPYSGYYYHTARDPFVLAPVDTVDACVIGVPPNVRKGALVATYLPLVTILTCYLPTVAYLLPSQQWRFVRLMCNSPAWTMTIFHCPTCRIIRSKNTVFAGAALACVLCCDPPTLASFFASAPPQLPLISESNSQNRPSHHF